MVRVLFKKLRGCHGQQEGKTIWVNLATRANPGHTFIHEQLHLKNPTWSETRVRKETTAIWKKLDVKQRLKVYKKLFRGGKK